MSEPERPGEGDGAGGAVTARPVAALFEAAVAEHQAGRLDAASALYGEIVAIDPGHAATIAKQGALALQTDDLEGGIALLRRSLALDDGNARAHYNLALAAYRTGDRSAALVSFQRATALEPGFAEAHNNIGALLIEERKLGAARAALEQAISLRPGYADAHNNLASALKAGGALDGALEQADAALAAEPGHVAALNTRATILIDQGKPIEAEATLRRALELSPQDPGALCNLGIALRSQGRFEDAQHTFEQAIATNPADARALTNLGLLFRDLYQFDAAIDALRRAARLNPQDADAVRNLGATFWRLDHPDEALVCFRQAVALDPDDSVGWQHLATGLVAAAQARDGAPADEAFWRDLGLCLGRPDVDHAVIARTAADAIKARPEARPYLDAMASGSLSLSATDAARGTFPIALGGKILIDLLARGFVADPDLERLLTAARRDLLDLAVASRLPEQLRVEMFAFVCALARQCFLNEYVYGVSEAETTQVGVLERMITERIADEHEPLPLTAIGVLASYRPLHALAARDALLAREECAEGDGFFAQLIKMQLRDPLAEAALRGGIAALGTIEDSVSERVRAQYEEHPYPRWHEVPPVAPQPIGAWLAESCPHLPPEERSFPDRPAVLIAGTGTGRQAINASMTYMNARITALDLSRAALAYGARKAAERGIGTIAWLHGDILDLGGLNDQRFDLIECGGVLHHMRDPLAGWRVLIDRLAPGGVMRIALYSEIGRQDVVAARDLHASLGDGPVEDRLRAFRARVLDLPDDDPVRGIVTRADFFSMSMCRDLVAHVQEHRFTLLELGDALDTLGLEFLGFELRLPPFLDLYRRAFPEDPTATDLASWHRYEKDNPDTFRNMYTFWVRPRPSASP